MERRILFLFYTVACSRRPTKRLDSFLKNGLPVPPVKPSISVFGLLRRILSQTHCGDVENRQGVFMKQRPTKKKSTRRERVIRIVAGACALLMALSILVAALAS